MMQRSFAGALTRMALAAVAGPLGAAIWIWLRRSLRRRRMRRAQPDAA